MSFCFSRCFSCWRSWLCDSLSRGCGPVGKPDQLALEDLEGAVSEQSKRDLAQTASLLQMLDHGRERNRRGLVERIAIRPCAERGENHALDLVLLRQIQARLVSAPQQPG